MCVRRTGSPWVQWSSKLPQCRVDSAWAWGSGCKGGVKYIGIMQSLRVQRGVIIFGVIEEPHASGSQRTVHVALRQPRLGGHCLVPPQLPRGSAHCRGAVLSWEGPGDPSVRLGLLTARAPLWCSPLASDPLSTDTWSCLPRLLPSLINLLLSS